MTKAIITRDIEIRGDRERPRLNVSISLKASKHPQTLPKWVIDQALARGAAEIVQPRRAGTQEESDASASEAG